MSRNACKCQHLNWGTAVAFWICAAISLAIGAWMPFDWYSKFPHDGFPLPGVMMGLLMWLIGAFAAIRGYEWLHAEELIRHD